MSCNFFRDSKKIGRLLMLSPLLFTGCFAPVQTDDNPFPLNTRAGNTTALENSGEEQGPAVPKLSDERLQALIAGASDDSSTWSQDDDEAFTQLGTYETRTKLEEAALVVGLLRQYRIKHPQDQSSGTFVQENVEQLTAPQPEAVPASGEMQATEAPPSADATSLKGLAEAAGVNLATAFTNNSYLKTYEIVALCLKVLKQAQFEDPDYTQRIETPVRTLLNRWKKLGVEEVPAQPAVSPGSEQPVAGPLPEAALPMEGSALPNKADLPGLTAPTGPAPTAEVNPTTPPATPSPEVAPALPYNSDVFKGDETELRGVQALMDQGNYQEAVKRLGQFKADSPFYAAALEKTKTAKNLAVQDLRKKAATAFQSSLPVNDPKAKVVYLAEAQGYLEQALSLYPDAEQIETVKQNLNVIKKNLAQVKP
jgi:tetratricopeptide (TPR) repeat protein